MHRLSRLALLLALAGVTASGPLVAGGMGGTVTAQMTLTGGCTVSGGGSSASSSGNFGMLDFGVQPSTFTGVLVAGTTGGGTAGATQIQCSPEVAAMSVSVSAGNHPGQGASWGAGTRAMKLSGSNYLPYEVYSDASMTTAYPVSGGALGVSLTAAGDAVALPVFGRIHKTHGGAIPSGTYVDVLQVTLSW